MSCPQKQPRRDWTTETQDGDTAIEMLLVIKEEVPSELSPSLDQEDPERPHIKETQETNQEGEQLQGLEEGDNSKFPIVPVPVKIEDEEEPLDCGGSEAARNLDSQPDTDSSETDDSVDDWQEPLSVSEHETEDSDSGSKETRTPQSGLNTLKSDEVHRRDTRCNAGKKSFSCTECGAVLGHKHSLQTHMRVHTGEKPFRCKVCGKRFTTPGNVKTHMRVHTGEKPFGCDVCGKRFTTQGNVETHMRVHTGEKPFGCDVCGKRFSQQGEVNRHKRVHTGEKPFGCYVCGKDFTRQGNLKAHMKVHT